MSDLITNMLRNNHNLKVYNLLGFWHEYKIGVVTTWDDEEVYRVYRRSWFLNCIPLWWAYDWIKQPFGTINNEEHCELRSAKVQLAEAMTDSRYYKKNYKDMRWIEMDEILDRNKGEI